MSPSASAAPVLGGMLTVLILSLLVFPVIYSLVLQFQEERKSRLGVATHEL
jgi:Cu(I)/Ag(I) efflux system membrane protein CusA/SilA